MNELIKHLRWLKDQFEVGNWHRKRQAEAAFSDAADAIERLESKLVSRNESIRAALTLLESGMTHSAKDALREALSDE